jgi:hypothetical protein
MSGRGCTVIKNSCDPNYKPNPYECSNLGAVTCNGKTSIQCIPNSVTPVPPAPGNTLTTSKSVCTSNGLNGIDTAIGCIPVETNIALVEFLLRWAVGIGGGVAFILLVVSGFMIMTASGNPEKLQAGKELMTSAIMGLIMLIFSVFLLKIIGVDILQLTLP